MALSIEVLSKETIKPSIPTPENLRVHQLCLLDQFLPHFYTPIIFFYSSSTSDDHDHRSSSDQFDQRVKLLKQSLSKALNLFYPLAGTVDQDDNIINCNDEGVEFIEAKVDTTSCNFEQVIEDADVEVLEQLLPLDNTYGSNIKNVVLSIQVSHFANIKGNTGSTGGGMAIGVCISHKIADATSIFSFMNSWAAIARSGGGGGSAGCDQYIMKTPNFVDASKYFPPKDLSGMYTSNVTISEKKIATRRFIFDERMISLLKSKASSSNTFLKDPTRVEVISAFLWEHIVSATTKFQFLKNLISISAATQCVNLRSRIEPSLPEESFGNISYSIIALLMKLGKAKSHDFVESVGKAIRKIDHDFIKSDIQSGKFITDFNRAYKMYGIGAIAEYCSFSSWCRSPVYEADFGWCKPIWVATASYPFKNLAILSSTRNGDGIEAWVNVEDEGIFPILERHLQQLSIEASRDQMP